MSKSAIRQRGPRENLVGRRFGKLVVQEWAGQSRWRCNCDCGGESLVITANLKRENTTSCGCIRNIASSRRATKHGLSHTHAYKTWISIKRRCYEKQNAGYKHYGAKGIVMHAAWINDVASFVGYVGQPPSDNYTLDRIDNAKGYVPGNLRWATPVEQASNKTNNRMVIWRGEAMTLAQLARLVAEEVGVSYAQMRAALENAMYHAPPGRPQ